MTDLLQTEHLDVVGSSGTLLADTTPPRLYAEKHYLVRRRSGVFPANLASVTTALPGTEDRVLRFRNFVGLADVDGMTVRVDSRRINAPEAERMLTEIVKDVQRPPSRAQPPTGEAFDRPFGARNDAELLEYLVVRNALSGKGPHDLRAAVARILARPHERLADERIDRPIWAVDRVDGRTIANLIASSVERIPVPADSRLADAPLTGRLGGTLPARVEVTRSIPTTDTLENRFIATVLDRCLALVRSVMARAARGSSPGLGPLRDEAMGLAETLENWRAHRVLDGLDSLRRLPTTSTVLRGRPGYRNVLRFYADLLGYTRLFPPAAMDQIIALRNIAELYEWWCFFRVVDAASEVLQIRPKLKPPSADWEGATLGYGTTARWDNGIAIQFNRTFSKGTETYQSYSLKLRPDILVETPHGRHVFDAKFSFELPGPWLVADDDEREADGGTSRAWRSHIHKMHTYRDALDRVRSVRVLYPGTQAEWHAVAASDPNDGVGAIPLRVGNSADAQGLRSVLHRIIWE